MTSVYPDCESGAISYRDLIMRASGDVLKEIRQAYKIVVLIGDTDKPN